MPFRRWRCGFYEGSRPVEARSLDYVEYLRRAAGEFFDSRRPDLLDSWRAAAEIRLVMSRAIESGLPPDSPPELVMLMAADDDGNLLTVRDLENAEAACRTRF